MLTSYNITQWPFWSGSSGIRLQILIGSYRDTALAFRLFPQNTPAEDNVVYNNFDAIGVDTNTRQATYWFPRTCIIDGVQREVINVTGVYKHSFDFDQKYVYVDLPKGNVIEYTLYERILPEDLSAAFNLSPAVYFTLSILIAMLFGVIY